MKQAKYLLLFMAVFLANCKSPVSPQAKPKITFFSPKDTTLTDSLRVNFLYQIENASPARNILRWDFGDGTYDSSSVSSHFLAHSFPGAGSYSFSVVLLDTVLKTKVDSVLGTVHIVASPPSLAELQQMKYCKLQVYSRVYYSHEDFSTGRYLSDTEFHFFDIDPIALQDITVSPFPVDGLGSNNAQINWSGNKFNLIYYKALKDSHDTALGGSIQWDIECIINKNNSKIDSFYLNHQFGNTIYWGTHAPMKMGIGINAICTSIPFTLRTLDTLMFQEIRLDSVKTLNYINYSGENNYLEPPPFVYTGPYWTPLYHSSYVRIILYK